MSAPRTVLSECTIAALNAEVIRSRAEFPDERAHFVESMCGLKLDGHVAVATAVAVRISDLASTLADSIMLDRPLGPATAIKLAALALRIAEEGPHLESVVSK